MIGSVRIEFSDKFDKWVVRKMGLSRDDVTLHDNLLGAVTDAQIFLRREKERHDRSQK